MKVALQRALIASGAGAPQRVRGNVLMVNAHTSLPVARAKAAAVACSSAVSTSRPCAGFDGSGV